MTDCTVFDAPLEVVENILLNLSAREILCATRISRVFKDAIDSSPRIARRLGRRRKATKSINWRTINGNPTIFTTFEFLETDDYWLGEIKNLAGNPCIHIDIARGYLESEEVNLFCSGLPKPLPPHLSCTNLFLVDQDVPVKVAAKTACVETTARTLGEGILLTKCLYEMAEAYEKYHRRPRQSDESKKTPEFPWKLYFDDASLELCVETPKVEGKVVASE
jgi:hypothetical protein